jgi:hypothetical protein
MWVVSFTTRPPYLRGKSPRYPLDRRLGGPQNRSGCGGVDKVSKSLQEIEPRSSNTYCSHYTDWAVPSNNNNNNNGYNNNDKIVTSWLTLNGCVICGLMYTRWFLGNKGQFSYWSPPSIVRTVTPRRFWWAGEETPTWKTEKKIGELEIILRQILQRMIVRMGDSM